ncbi:DUF302 domain-containing protein [Lysinibacillus sp. CTST325]
MELHLTETLHKKGVDGFKMPYRILEVCNPVEAAKVLGHNALVGYFLPCKITVYIRCKENENRPSKTNCYDRFVK